MSEQGNDATLPSRRKSAAEALGIDVPNGKFSPTHDPKALETKIAVAQERVKTIRNGKGLTPDEIRKIEKHGYSAFDILLGSGYERPLTSDRAIKSHKLNAGRHRASEPPVRKK